MANQEINLKAVTKSMGSLRRTFKEITSGSRNTEKLLAALSKAMEQTARSGGKLNRALASFDQLNRLAAPASGSAAGKVEEVTKAFQELRAETIKPMNIASLDNLPGSLVGVAGSLSLVGEEIFRNSRNLSDHTALWDRLTVQLGVTTQGMETFQTQTMTLEEVVNATRGQLGTMIGSLDLTAGATLGLKERIQELEQANTVGTTSIIDHWKVVGPWFDTSVSQPVKGYLSDMFGQVGREAKNAWDATTLIFSQTGGFFQGTFSDAWARVKAVFSDNGPVFEGIKGGILSGFKIRVNALIDVINALVPDSFNGINTALNSLRTIRIGGQLPFATLKWNANMPRIPHLAQGAVLPANKPFMAVVGDQRHGTNVEAPLETITEAVRLAMEDLQDGNLSGHRATVELLGRILEAVRNIHLTDGEIAAANHRYEQKQAIMYGI